ncbi:MAG: hypothetical protein HY646_16080, partial [Acidobacteria bacterium]|nr:hypothetical protein [Acidobacteriota bacterium]
AYSGDGPYEQLRDAQDEFGQWDDRMEFFPYWNNADYVTVTPRNENLVCSVFRGPSKAMLVVFNNTDQDIPTQITVNLPRLGVSGTTLRDLVSRERFPLARGAADVPVPDRDYRMLVVE